MTVVEIDLSRQSQIPLIKCPSAGKFCENCQIPSAWLVRAKYPQEQEIIPKIKDNSSRPRAAQSHCILSYQAWEAREKIRRQYGGTHFREALRVGGVVPSLPQ